MKTEVRDGKTITVFDNVEEMKWYFHAKLCRNSSDTDAVFMTKMYELGLTVAELNKYLKMVTEPCEVKVT